MGKFQHVVRAALGYEGVVDVFLDQDRAQWLGTIGDLLGTVHDVRCHTKSGGAGHGTSAAKAGNHLIKDQQNVVGCADIAQTLQIAFGRDDDAGRTRHGFNDHRSDIAGIVQSDQAQQIVGQLGTAFGHAA